MGIIDFAFALVGFLAPAITGWVLGLHGSFQNAFLLMAALSSVLVLAVFHHPDADRTKNAGAAT